MFNKDQIDENTHRVVANSRRISEIEDRVSRLENDVREVLEKNTKIFEALVKYLDVELRWETEDDPYYLKPKPPQVEVLRVYKKINKKNV